MYLACCMHFVWNKVKVSVVEINYFVCSKCLLPGITNSSKTYMYVSGSKSWRLKYSPIPTPLGNFRLMTKQKSMWSKALICL